MSWQIYTEFFVGLFIALNPIASITCFMTLTPHLSVQEKRAFVTRAIIAASIAVVATIILGQMVLEIFGISLGAFRVAAGLALLFIGLKMMREGPEKPKLDGLPGTDLEIVPFAIPIVVGPGTLGFITAQTEDLPGIIDNILFLAIGLFAIFTQWVILVNSHHLSRILKKKGMDVATRIMGLILMAIGMDAISKGMLMSFPGLAH